MDNRATGKMRFFTNATWTPREFPKRDKSVGGRAAVHHQASEHCMAFQQAGNKGTLVPGQTIAVNKYTVQVERYLSQGLIVSTFRLAASVTTTDRRLCTRLSRQDSYRSVWNNTPCPQTHCSLK